MIISLINFIIFIFCSFSFIVGEYKKTYNWKKVINNKKVLIVLIFIGSICECIIIKNNYNNPDKFYGDIKDYYELFSFLCIISLILLYVYIQEKIIDFKIKKQIEKIDDLDKTKNKKVSKQKNHKSNNKQDKKINLIKLKRGFIKK